MSLQDRLRQLKSLAGPFAPFDVAGAPDDPAALFLTWLEEAIAAGIREPHAMTLSTVDAEGRPDARILILKSVDAQGWHFASTKAGPKGRQIAAQPHAALTFYWQPFGRQVRLRGPVRELSRDVCDADFRARPLAARAGALAERQSEVVPHEEDMAAALAEHRQRLDSDPSLVSQAWTVYALWPAEIEFWQASTDRQHARLRYRQAAGNDWVRERLWP